jgi:hypothetical protein
MERGNAIISDKKILGVEDLRQRKRSEIVQIKIHDIAFRLLIEMPSKNLARRLQWF